MVFLLVTHFHSMMLYLRFLELLYFFEIFIVLSFGMCCSPWLSAKNQGKQIRRKNYIRVVCFCLNRKENKYTIKGLN
ncbi:hypothetical protein RJT34_32376 [Clitoria ternatea]|uniref:Uncharacterized protein n=1 Tax=Clitoria ternatea TaxID=43366 RepID=A0AAN9EY64_CLITE